MKTTDFLFQNQSKALSIFVGGLLAFCALQAMAAAPVEDSFDQPGELILTLSEQPLADADQGTSHLLGNAAKGSATAKQTETRKTRPVNLGCGVDVNSLPTENSSLSGRLVGECNFQYHY